MSTQKFPPRLTALERELRNRLLDARAARSEVARETFRAGFDALFTRVDALNDAFGALNAGLDVAGRSVGRRRGRAGERGLREDLLNARAARLVVTGQTLETSLRARFAFGHALGHGLAALDTLHEAALVVETKGRREEDLLLLRGGGFVGALERKFRDQLFNARAAGGEVACKTLYARGDAGFALRDARNDGLGALDAVHETALLLGRDGGEGGEEKERGGEHGGLHLFF